jgi:DNA-binding NarL/FixJ family response regulator
MLVGQNNEINEKLVAEISAVFPIKFKDVKSVLEGSDQGYSPRILLINLMDVGSDEEELLRVLKKEYPNRKMIAIHCFQTENLIKKTLEKGYDSYLSIFNVSEDFLQELQA